MERRRGIILRDRVPQQIERLPDYSRLISQAFIDCLVRLHAIDLHSSGLLALGKPEGFLERQVRGWADRWQRSGREVADDGQIEAAQVSPAEIEKVERQATLFRLVDTLPAEQRRVVVLRFVEQKSIKEVARQISKTEGAVKQLQFRALSNLRARMEGDDA